MSADISEGPGAADRQGYFADNIVYFARALREAGMRFGPASVKDAIEAVLATGLGRRDDFYWTLHAVLVNRHEDHVTFDEAFHRFWKSRDLAERILSAEPDNSEAAPRGVETRTSRAMFASDTENRPPQETPRTEVDVHLAASSREALRSKDFARMSVAELSAAKRAIADLRLPFELVRSRRFRPAPHGGRVDPRAMMRAASRTGGTVILPRFRSRRKVHPPLVVLADISGSMSQYSRIFLHFLHAIAERRRHVHTFVFGTRLTDLTRQMRCRDADEALAVSADAVRDWSGGTRIGETLSEFNRLWSRRVLGQGAVVLLITDGLERDEVGKLPAEMERLQKSCRRLIWLNPLLRFEGFEARARGVRAMLPYVDEFRPVHNLDALSDLCAALGVQPARETDPMRWLGIRARRDHTSAA